MTYLGAHQGHSDLNVHGFLSLIFIKRDIKDPSCYRPTDLQSILSKVMEGLVIDQMEECRNDDNGSLIPIQIRDDQHASTDCTPWTGPRDGGRPLP